MTGQSNYYYVWATPTLTDLDPGDRLRVSEVIFNELVCGRLEDNSRRYFGELRVRSGCAWLHGDPDLGRRAGLAIADPRFNSDPRTRGAARGTDE